MTKGDTGIEAQPSAARDGGDAADWYARRPWTARYPDFMRADIDLEPDATALSLLRTACARYADRVAFEFDGERLTYREWQRQADALARFLVHEWQLAAGDRVLFLLPNLPAFPVALLAAWTAGLVIVPMLTATTTHEFEDPIADAAPKAIVGIDVLMKDFRAARGAGAVRELIVATPPALFGPADAAPAHAVGLDAAIATGAALPPVQRTVRPGDLALLQYTGGTTGVSKAVITTQRNMLAEVEMLRMAVTEYARPEPDLVVSVHPFFHSAGMAVTLLQYSSNGATHLLFPKSKAPEPVVAGWRGRDVTAILAGPAFYNALLAAPGFADLDFTALRAGFVGGMPLRPDIRERWERITGAPMIEGYGLTELAGPLTAQMGRDRRDGSVGFPLPSIELTIRDPDDADHHAMPPGVKGEIWLRGPCLMPGYYGRPDETARAMTADGWFRTGDVGRMDAQGYLYLLGRIKDIIIVASVNVYPSEIEDVVGALPGVADVCAVGMPDPDHGERVRLFVARRNPQLDTAAVTAWCAERLSDYKCPKRIEFVDALPRSAAGKVLRRELGSRPLV
jgi:long-chain acyl-CoA synthetase